MRRWVLGAVAVVVAASTVVSAPATDASPGSVVLGSGDRVLVAPAGRYEFRAAPGRERMSHRTLSIDGHVFVVPGDALVPFAAGTVDRRRFDVTAMTGRTTGEIPLSARDSAGDHDVTFSYLDRAGAATGMAATFVFGIDSDVVRMVAPEPDGTATVSLPPGRYHVESTVDTPRSDADTPSTSLLVNPELAVTQDTAVTVDATVARPVTVTVPDRQAMHLSTSVGYWRLLGRGPIAVSVGHPEPTALFSAHTGPEVPGSELMAVTHAYFARPGPDDTAANSPLVYAAAWDHSGRIPTGFRKRVTEAELSTVHTEHAALAEGRRATKLTRLDLPPYGRFGYAIDYSATPFARVERYAGTVRWTNVLEEYAPTEDRADGTSQLQPPTDYRPGRRYTERWNLAPVRPDPRVQLTGDAVVVEPALYGDLSAHVGTSTYRRAHVTLHRDGQLVGATDRLDRTRFPVPEGPAGYRLTATADRDFTDLATTTTTTWTFTTTPATAPRFEPPVDRLQRAPGGRRVAMPVHVTATATLTVAVSYDSGTTWLPVRVTGAGEHRIALLDHPPAPGTVSLRTALTDGSGATVTTTVTNAYQLA